MIAVFGGQLDPNIGRFLRRLIQRGAAFQEILVGPDCLPEIELDIITGALFLSGKRVAAKSLFLRHDVFWNEKDERTTSSASALNWFYAIRGWSAINPQIRIFNRHSQNSENNKISNLKTAMACGLKIPSTSIKNIFSEADFNNTPRIVKPVAGGEFTRDYDKAILSEFDIGNMNRFPRFIQDKLSRPELRAFVIGSEVVGFKIASASTDYRNDAKVQVSICDVPEYIVYGLLKLCEELRLNFAAADFMLDDEGSYTFLEINTQPMFVAFDNAAGGALVDRMIDFLMRF